MNKFLKVSATIVAITAILALLMCKAVAAQENPVLPTEPAFNFVMFGEVMASWLIYFVAGMLNAVAKKENFNGGKMATSFVLSIAVGTIALITGLQPQIVWQSHGDVISTILVQLANAGVFLPLIYFFTKIFGVVSAVWKRAQAAWTVPK